MEEGINYVLTEDEIDFIKDGLLHIREAYLDDNEVGFVDTIDDLYEKLSNTL